MVRFVLGQVLMLGLAGCQRASAPPRCPAGAPESPPSVVAVSPYGDLLAHEVMNDTSRATDESLRDEGVRALDEERFEDAREIFADLLERNPEDETLVGWHRQAETMAHRPDEDDEWSIGIPDCDEYLRLYAHCVERLPDAAREQTRAALVQTLEAWREAAKGPAREVLGETCSMAREAARTATAALGCEW
jgi:hypothetical protein